MNLCAWTAEKLSNFPPPSLLLVFYFSQDSRMKTKQHFVGQVFFGSMIEICYSNIVQWLALPAHGKQEKTFITELLLQHTTSSATSFLSPRRYSKCDEYGVWTLMVGPQAKQDLLQFLFALQFDSTKIDSNSTWSYWDLCLIFRLLRFNL